MDDHVYRIIEVVGTSPQSMEAAVQNALTRAAETVREIGWFEVGQIRGHVVDGKIGHYQVAVKVGFRIEDGPAN